MIITKTGILFDNLKRAKTNINDTRTEVKVDNHRLDENGIKKLQDLHFRGKEIAEQHLKLMRCQ